MRTLFVVVVMAATALHTVLGCCWHHAHATPSATTPHASQGHSSCCAGHSHADSGLRAAPLCPAQLDDGARLADGVTDPSSPDAPPVSPSCGGAKCIFLLPDEAPRLDPAATAWPLSEPAAELALQVSPARLAEHRGERFLIDEPWRPARAHLLLCVLLI